MAVSGDERSVSYFYAPYSSYDAGAELEMLSTYDQSGAEVMRVEYGGHTTFGAPETILVTGYAGTSRRTDLEYSTSGQLVLKTTQMEGTRTIEESFEYGDCGQPTRNVDAAGRITTMAYDTCRLSERQFAGGSVETLYDEFGRAAWVEDDPVERRDSHQNSTHRRDHAAQRERSSRHAQGRHALSRTPRHVGQDRVHDRL